MLLVDLSLRSVVRRGFPREILVAGLLDARERLFPRHGYRSSLVSRATHPPPFGSRRASFVPIDRFAVAACSLRRFGGVDGGG